MYNFTSFAMTLNELEPGAERLLAPTDCRLRPDVRAMENGDIGKHLLNLASDVAVEPHESVMAHIFDLQTQLVQRKRGWRRNRGLHARNAPEKTRSGQHGECLLAVHYLTHAESVLVLQ